MEAVGQLTGGVAHDFNNILQVIVGNLELDPPARAPASPKDPPGGSIRRSTGARQASSLPIRLLAFSRRQPLEPESD